MEQIVTEILHAARRLRKSPGFTAIVVLTLALGIGANSAIFSIVNGVLLRPLPYADPGSLVSVTHLYPSLDGLEPGLAAPTFRDLTEESRSFESIAVRAGWMPNLIGEGEPERVTGSRVNGAFFNTYGVPAALGRSILPSDAEGDGARVVVLGHGLWRRVFGEDSGVIGRSILLSGESYEVVGVMPPAFRDFFAPAAEMWSPLTITGQQLSDNGRTNEFLLMSVRLRPGVSVGQAEQEMAAVGLRLRTDFPASYPSDWSLRLHTLNHLATSEIRPALMILLAAVAFVLLIACANVASLLLARASARRKEIAIRGAMGARRADLVRQLLVEGVVLATMGAALGLFLASSALSLLRATNPLDLPRAEDISIDATVLLFTMSLAVVTGILFGLVPALQLAGTDLQSTLREGGRGSSDRRGATVRRGLVVAEIALALALLIGAGLLIRSFTTLQRVDPGFNPEGVAVMTVPLPVTKFETPEARFAFHEELSERLRGLPGVTAVGRTSKLPFTEGMSTRSFIVEGMELTDGEPAPWGDFRVVDHEYREALQIPLIRGRFFTAADRRDAPGVAIVDEEMVRRYWPGEEPIGKRLAYNLDEEGNPIWLEVVGVIGHTAQEGLDAEARLQFYRPHAQVSDAAMAYAIRTTGDPLRVIPAARAALRAIDPDQPVADVSTLQRNLDQAMGGRRLSASLIGFFAALALLLAALGIYGVISFDVSRRTQEMGLRMALGSGAGGILLLVMRYGLKLTALGIGIGLFTAYLLSSLIAGQLYGVAPTDPVTFVAVPLTLAAVAALASYLPARRATRVDPMVALRND